jgi:hypothetical protein
MTDETFAYLCIIYGGILIIILSTIFKVYDRYKKSKK